MGDLVLQKAQVPSWVSYAHQRIKKNKNFLLFISGSTGSGKSWSSLAIAEMVDPEFNIDRVVFTALELMELINHGKLKRGSAIVFEETGVELSNKNWQSVFNKMISYLLQTFRHRNFILILNAPFLDFIDSSMRKLFHGELRTVSINRKKNTVKMRPLLLQYNSRLKKHYFKYLRIRTPKGIVPIARWNIPRPSSKLIREYEVKKRRFTDALNREILEQLKKAKNAKPKKKMKCVKCEYRWFPKTKSPLRCPKCRRNPY